MALTNLSYLGLQLAERPSMLLYCMLLDLETETYAPFDHISQEHMKRLQQSIISNHKTMNDKYFITKTPFQYTSQYIIYFRGVVPDPV